MSEIEYRVGDWVEVRSPGEIFQTLDADGAVDNMPFMPEMLQFSGQRLQVSASAHKACDTLESYQNRRIDNAVHLGVRCDGSAHGGCQAACLMYWKTSWLKPVDGPLPAGETAAPDPLSAEQAAVIERATLRPKPGDTEERYSCQVTRLVEWSQPMRKSDVTQFWKDFRSRNVSARSMLKYIPLALYNTAVSKLKIGKQFPSVKGTAGSKTPSEFLDLQPGELVEVKSADEIMKTLDDLGRNRGMYFDTEMLPFCGKQYRVKERVSRLIDERTGVMTTMKTPGIVLEDVICLGCYHANRIFCPRGIPAFWREIWLKRVEA